MKKIISSFKLNIARNYSNKISVVMSIIIIPLVVIVSFYSIRTDSLGTVAVVGDDESLISYLEENDIDYEIKEKAPIKEELYMRLYVGTIFCDRQNTTIESYYGSKKAEVLQSLADRCYVGRTDKKEFSDAFFISLCIVLIQAVLNMKMFISDRKNGIMSRLRISNFSSAMYVFSYLLFNWMAIFIPYGISLCIGNAIFLNADILENLKILFISFIVSGLFSSIALFICVCVKDNASTIMMGNIIAVFTTLLSGMFGSIENKVFVAVSRCMPQRISYMWVDKVFHEGNMFNVHLGIIVMLGCCFYILSELLFRKWLSNGS